MKRIVLLFAVFALASLTACGGVNFGNLPPVNGGSGNYTASSLSGTWIYTLRGSSFYSGDYFVANGTFTTDSRGKITAGTQTVNSLIYGPSTSITFTGGYTVNSDGRGQMQFNYGGNNGSSQFRFVFTSSGNGRLLELSGSEDASGTLVKLPDATAQVVAPRTFVVRLDGYSLTGSRVADVGVLNFATNGAATLTYDENYNGSYSTGNQLTGTYTGNTLALGSRSFVYLASGNSHIELVETSSNMVTGGSGEAQGTGFAASSMTGNYIYSISGVSSGTSGYVPVNEVGRAALDGTGNVTGGTRDQNLNGTLSSVSPVGNYTVDGATGHFTLTLTNGSGTTYDALSGYLISNGWALVISSSGPLESGVIRQQTVTPATSTLNGSYGLQWTGVNWNTGLNIETLAATKFDGAGGVTGTMDYTTGGSLTANQSVNGTYSLDSNGRGTVTLNSIPFTVYDVDATQAYFLSADATREYQGNFVLQ